MSDTTANTLTLERLQLKMLAVESLLEDVQKHTKKATSPNECTTHLEQVTIIVTSRCSREQHVSTIKLTTECHFNTLPIFQQFLDNVSTRLAAEKMVLQMEIDEMQGSEGVK